MGLISSKVYKCLEKKTLILGFEIIDLFALSFVLCLLNFLFAAAEFKFFYTFGPVLILAAVLRAAKAGQAQNFILHWLRFQIAPGVFRAFPKAKPNNILLTLQRRESTHARFNAR